MFRRLKTRYIFAATALYLGTAMSNIASAPSTPPTVPSLPADLKDTDSPTEASSSSSTSGSSDTESESDNDSPYVDTVKPPVITSLDDVAERIKTGTFIRARKRDVDLIREAKNVILLVGAGVSVSAGIPDFRSPDTGLYANLQRFNLPAPEAIFDLGFFQAKPEPFFMLCKDLYPGKHLPTPAHYFFRLLHQHGVLKRVFTQNIDTLESVSGLPEEMIVEAHGSFAKSHCLGCRRETPHEEMLENVRQGKVVRCKECNALVKPDIVFFGEGLPDRFFQLMRTDLPKCDLLIVIGTSLQVHPFASLIDYVPDDCPRVLINKERVGEARHRWDDGFRFEERSRDYFWQGEADVGAEELARRLGWSDELDGLVKSHRAELRKQWNIQEPAEGESKKDSARGEPETMTATAEDAEDVLARLSEDLKKIGLEDKSEL